jgi:uncharacterized membrane protein
MSSIGKAGPIFCVGVLAGYLACRFVSRGWLGAVLACLLSSLGIAASLFCFYPAKLQAHFVTVGVGSSVSWLAICSVPGLLGYAIRRWYEPWMDSLRDEDREDSRNSDNASFIRDKLKVLNARRLSRAMSRRKVP